MSWRAWLGLTLLALLGFFVNDLANRVVTHFDVHVEPGRRRLATLSAGTRARLASFDEELKLVYYVTERNAVPSHLTHLEDQVRAGLEAIARGVSGPVEVLVVHPDARPELAESLASAGVAPWRARRIEGDGYREELLWSSLRLCYGARPAVVLHGIGTQEAQAVQELVLSTLEQLRSPRRPRIALSAPAGFDRLREVLATGAELVELDFAADPEALGEDIDLFFWLGGAHAGPRQLAKLDELRERGGSALISVESLDVRESWSDGQVSGHFVRDAQRMEGASALLAHTGLTARAGVLFDPRGAEVLGPEGATRIAPWRVRATPDHQDFRGLGGQPNAALLFAKPTAMQLEPTKLAELGFEASVLASASAGASLHELPTGALSPARAAALQGLPAPRAPLLVRLASTDSWRGERYIFADASPLSDANFDAEMFGHGALLQVLLAELTSDERMVQGRVAAARPAPLGELDTRSRFFMRALVLGCVPLLLALAFLLRRGAQRSWSPLIGPMARFLVRAVPAFAVLILVVRATQGLGLDATRDGRNRMTAGERATLAHLLQGIEGELLIEVAFSDEDHLPPEFRPLARETRRACEEFAEAIDGLRCERLAPDDWEEPERARRGVERLALSSTVEELTHLRRAFASVILSGDGGEQRLDFPTVASFDELRFRLAFALQRLARGEPTRIALFAEAPRLSPAEAALEFQRLGLFAPRAAAVYGELEALLTRNDFVVQRIDATQSLAPGEFDALLVLQPRRDVTPILATLSRYLAAGGQALLAAQHFAVKARQLEARGLELAFWPQPQFCDLDSLYLPELGVSLEREVLFDSPAGSLQVTTRIDREDGSVDYEPQESTQSFLLRCEPDTTVAPLFAGVGEVLLPFPSGFHIDAPRLEAGGLSAQVWLRTSPRSWSYLWKGGDLPRAALEGQLGADEALQARPGRALGLLLEGCFPPAWRIEPEGGGLAQLALEQARAEPTGQLLLLGDSEVFGDELLTLEGYAHDALALRCVAQLALDADLAAFLQQARNTPGLEPLDDSQRRNWRLFVIGGFPLALALFGLWRRRVA